MKLWFLIVTIVIAGMFLAKTTYQAGLRQFGIALGLVGTAGWLLLGAQQWLPGISLLVVNCLLFLMSRFKMKKHRIGPWAKIEP
jgi:hypothetical protein